MESNKKRPGQVEQLVATRVQPDLPSRPEALRRLVVKGLRES